MRTAFYARVSSGSEEQANALEQQISRLEEKCAALGDADPLRYIDIDSGSKDDRPELARLLRDCSAGLISGVIVTRLDRLSRSSSHGATLLRMFSDPAFPNLIALDDSIDLSTAGGKFMARLLISWAEAETDRLAERVRHGNAHRRALRKPSGPLAPFGYQFTEDRCRLEPDPVYWPIAEAAVERFLREPNTTGLLDWFNDEHGHRWTSNYSLRRWISNPTLAGARVYGQQFWQTDPDTGKRKRISRPPGEFGEVIWTDDDGQPFQEPLLTREQLAHIHAIYAARATPGQRELKAGEARVLTGLVRCGDCSRTLNYHQPGKGADYWCLRCTTVGCPSRYKTMRANGVAEGMVAVLNMHAKELARHLDDIRRAQDNTISQAERELQEKIQQLEQMNDPDLQPVLDKKRNELARMRTDAPGDEMDSFLATVAELKQTLDPAGIGQNDPAVLRQFLKRFCRAEAKPGGGHLALIQVAEAIRRPGHERVINVEALKLGNRKNEQNGELTRAWLIQHLKKLRAEGMTQEEMLRFLSELLGQI